MILRLASGSATPASAFRKRSAAFTRITVTPRCSAKTSMTWSPSCRRSRPVSTNTQMSWSPSASWSSAATTEESTPPDRPSSTLSRPTWARTLRDLPGDDVAGAPGVGAAADVAHEALDDPLALLGVRDFGMELQAVEAAGLVGHAGQRRVGRAGDGLEARRQAPHPVAVAHPDAHLGPWRRHRAVRCPRPPSPWRGRTPGAPRTPPRRPAGPPWTACRSRCRARARRVRRPARESSA